MNRFRISSAPLRLFLVGAGLFVLSVSVSCGNQEGRSSSNGEPDRNPVSYKVMTYNILMALPNPEYDPWSVRKEFVAEALIRHEPDLIGLQEPLWFQITDLLERVPGYAALELSILDTDAAVLYKEERFEVEEYWIYWLSPTPDVPRSIGFGNFLYRMVLNVRLLDRESGREFFFVNTHFDNTSPSQEKSAPLFLERTEPLAREHPVIITGDFNSKPASQAFQTLTLGVEADRKEVFSLQDTFFLAPSYEVLGREGDDINYDPAGRIDHIFVAGGDFSCNRWIVDKTSYGQERKVPSDHFPIVAHVELNGTDG